MEKHSRDECRRGTSVPHLKQAPVLAARVPGRRGYGRVGAAVVPSVADLLVILGVADRLWALGRVLVCVELGQEQVMLKTVGKKRKDECLSVHHLLLLLLLAWQL